MSKKGKPIDVLGEAYLPADLITPTLADNYGLDGYPDMEYGLGVLEGLEPPGSSPSPGYKIEAEDENTPDIFGQDEEDLGPDFTEFMKEGGIQDLDWLELDEQDPERLPLDTTHGTMIPQLEEAWGMHQRTDGLYFYDNVDIDQARYQESLQTDPMQRRSSADLVRVVRRAMRRSAAGHDLNEILREAAEALGDEAPRIRRAMALVKAEHGLAGNVFIRAAAYPGYEQGKWDEALKKLKGARYIVMDKATLKSSTNIQGGYCTVTKKLAVTSVPWDEALDHYRPILEAAGRKLASGSPQQALRAAFLSHPEKLTRPAQHLPTHVAPAQQITRQAAWQKFHAAQDTRAVYDPLPAIEAKRRQAAWGRISVWAKAGLVPLDVAMSVVSSEMTGEDMLQRVAAYVIRTKGAAAFSGLPNDVRPVTISKEAATEALRNIEFPKPIDTSNRPMEAKRRQALATLARWVKAEMLSEADAHRLAKSQAEPLDVLRAASALVTATKKAGDFTGVANDTRIKSASREEVWEALKKAETQTKAAQVEMDKVARDRRAASTRAAKKITAVKANVDKIVEAIDKGVRGLPLRDLIVRTIPKDQVRLAAKYLDPVLRETGALEDGTRAARVYEGTAYREVPQKAASMATARDQEVEAMLRWTRKALNEGFAGTDLDDLLRAKFAESVRTAGAQKLGDLRSAHEGGAGFIYVDAAAYASVAGTSGCEKGGLQHRANTIRFVLAMDRCATCALAKVKSDGSRHCGKYHKQIVTAADLPEEMPAMRQDNIKAANLPDEEATASMFAPSFNPSEFNLHNDRLDDVEIQAAPETGELKDILFGGMEW